MEEVLTELRSWSLDDIRQNLIQRGESVGPSMPSMRHLFEKKLARRILRDRGLETCEDEEVPIAPSIPEEKPVVSNSEPDQFYALSLPQDLKGCQEKLIYSDKKEAIKRMKLIPGCRFKIFKDYNQAKDFTQMKAEDIVSTPKTKPQVNVPEKKEEKRSFKEPTRAERITLKSAVETGDVASMTSLMWTNPYYVITVGETPVVLHEAFRYNALHLAAKFNQAEICRQLLSIVCNDDFHQLLFSDDTEPTRRNRVHHLLDLFLNTPDKGGGDSALHFACKFGHPDVVRELIRYPHCDKAMLNKERKTPFDVINQRVNKPDADVAARIRKLLKGLVYVPLYRAFGNLPVVGHPVSEAELSDKTLKAYAGPMTPEQAKLFYHSWSVYPPNSPSQKQAEIRQTKRSDYDKGLERLGRSLASEFDVSWSEYWDFLNEFTDLRTPDGLQLLERFLHKRRLSSESSDLNGNSVSKRCVDRPPSEHADVDRNTDNQISPVLHSHQSVNEYRTINLNHSPDNASPEWSLSNSVSPGNSESPGNQSPGELSLLAQKFARLRLNDSGDTPARLKLRFDSDSDSDSDSDQFFSAPSSPETLRSNRSHGDSFHSDDDNDDDVFSDAVPFLCSTPVEKSRDGRDDVRSRDVFLIGGAPSKLDLDVLRAVGELSVKEDFYPNFIKWRQAVTSFSSNEMNQWPSPARLRRMRTSVPESPLATPTRHSTRANLADLKSRLDFES